MKKILTVLMVLALACSMLISCENAQSMLEKADEALKEAPYKVTMKLDFEADDEELDSVFSLMNMEIPVTVDGENVAMNLTMDVMGISATSNMVVADMVLYNSVDVMGQSAKLKATMNDAQYEEFMEENNTDMVIKPEHFGEFEVETKDGKKYIACGSITEEGLKELNGMIDGNLETMGAKASIVEVKYGITLDDGKYESMDMTCVYSITVEDKTCNVTLNMSAEYSYDNVEKITAPADADSYTEMSYAEIFG